VRGQLRIMVLDASPTSRKILEVILRREGHLVVCFGDSLEALRFLSMNGPADLLFLGLELPRVDGFDVLKYLRGKPRFQAMGTVALLGGGDGVLARLKARLAGAQQVVTKPLVRQRIIDLVSEYACRRAADRRAGCAARDDGGVAPGLEGRVMNPRLQSGGLQFDAEPGCKPWT
jgi:twitching motility two-component system response regulator PilG